MSRVKVFRVIKPGLFTTVQDLGRCGLQRYGVPVSGAMDTFSMIAANLLVLNQSGDACLEITLLGPELEVLNDTQIAITGADLSPTLNGQSVPMWRTLNVSKGDIISFGETRAGCRAYLAVAGGINVPVVLGSRSTFVRGGFGGFEGRPLKTWDVIEASEPPSPFKAKLSMPEDLIPHYENKLTVNVVLGPQADVFTDKGIETFLSSTYTVTTEADRMGYRLEGPVIEHKVSPSIISDAIPSGAVQVPEDGLPIIMMVDAQTTGGYAKIAVVTTPDLSRLAQVKPNDTVRFSGISMSQARLRLLEYQRALSLMETRVLQG